MQVMRKEYGSGYRILFKTSKLQEVFWERLRKDKKVAPYSQGTNSWEDASEYPYYVFVRMNIDGGPLRDEELEYIDKLINELNEQAMEESLPESEQAGVTVGEVKRAAEADEAGFPAASLNQIESRLSQRIDSIKDIIVRYLESFTESLKTSEAIKANVRDAVEKGMAKGLKELEVYKNLCEELEEEKNKIKAELKLTKTKLEDVGGKRDELERKLKKMQFNHNELIEFAKTISKCDVGETFWKSMELPIGISRLTQAIQKLIFGGAKEEPVRKVKGVWQCNCNLGMGADRGRLYFDKKGRGGYTLLGFIDGDANEHGRAINHISNSYDKVQS